MRNKDYLFADKHRYQTHEDMKLPRYATINNEKYVKAEYNEFHLEDFMYTFSSREIQRYEIHF